MTPKEFATQLRAAIDAKRQPVTRGELYAHPRGWNDALDAVNRSITEILGEKDDETK